MSSFGPPKGGWPDTKPVTVPRERKEVILPHPAAYGTRPVTLVKTDYFCPHCGKQDMWQDAKGGEDYYLGASTYCESCGVVTVCLDMAIEDREELK